LRVSVRSPLFEEQERKELNDILKDLTDDMMVLIEGPNAVDRGAITCIIYNIHIATTDTYQLFYAVEACIRGTRICPTLLKIGGSCGM